MAEVAIAGYVIISIIAAAFIVFLVLFLIAKSKGNVKINISNFNYSPGDTVQGKVSLHLKKPASSKFLCIYLRGVQKVRSHSVKRHGGQGVQVRDINVYDFRLPLEGKKDYPSGFWEYSFKIKIPLDIISKTSNPVANTIIRSLQVLGGSSPVRWFLIAELETPGFNLADKVQISIA